MISVFYQTCMLSLMVNRLVRESRTRASYSMVSPVHVSRIEACLNSEPQYLADARTAVAETNAEKIS